MSTFNGSCLCGTVRFSITAPSKWCAHCHCTMCQRAHGAAFVTWVGIDDKQFTIEDGAGSLRWYESSSDSQRGFCDRCGSTLLFRSQRWPGETHVVRSNIDGEVDRQPSLHGHHNRQVSWITLGDDLPRKQGSEYDTKNTP